MKTKAWAILRNGKLFNRKRRMLAVFAVPTSLRVLAKNEKLVQVEIRVKNISDSSRSGE